MKLGWAFVAAVMVGDGLFGDDDPAGAALPLRRFVASARDGRGGVAAADGDRGLAGSAVDDGKDLPAAFHHMWLRASRAGVGVLVDVDEVDGHRDASRTVAPLTRARSAAGVTAVVVSSCSCARSWWAMSAGMDMRVASWSAVMGRPVVASWLVTANRAVGIRCAGTLTGCVAGAAAGNAGVATV